MKRVLVTGGTGFLGAALTKELTKQGHTVRVLDDNSRGSPDRLETVIDDIELIDGDVRDASTVDRATQGMEWVFHLAFVNGTRFFYEMPQLVLDVGVKGGINTMDAAIRHGVERYILASSSEVYQQPTRIPTPEDERIIVPDVTNPRFSYSGGKIISELLALHYLGATDVQRVIFRPHNIYGPNMGMEHVIPELTSRLAMLAAAPQAGSIDFPIQGNGEETRAFCYVDDAAEGILLAATKGEDGEIYNVGVTEEVTIGEIARRIGRMFGVNLNLIPSSTLAGSTPRRSPDVSKLRALGYEPRISLEEGLRITCAWYAPTMSAHPIPVQ